MARIRKTCVATLTATHMFMSGCVEYRESPMKREKATVMQLAYVPPTHGSTSGGTGMTSSGKTVMTFGESFTTAEVWAVVFKCEDHGKTFSLRGKEIYEACRVGQTVWLNYVDVIEVRDGKEVVIDHHTKSVEPCNDPEKK